MKTTVLILTVALAGVLAGSGIEKKQNDIRLAEVQQEQGIYIFWKCKPVETYDKLGTIEAGGLVWSAKAHHIIPHMLKKLKADYPDANGLILYTETSSYSADAIKFTE